MKMPRLLQRLFRRTASPTPQRRSTEKPGRNIQVVRHKGGSYDALGYNAASVAVRDGRGGLAGSGESHQRYDRETLINESRRLERDNPIYQGMIDKAISYIVGNGFGLQAKTDDPQWNAKAEAAFKQFWKEPELTGLDSGVEVEQMVLREIIIAGDTGVLKTDQQKLQLFEAEQIKGPGSADNGIIRNDVGTVTGYYVSPYSDFAVQTSKARTLTAEEFLFLVRRKRPSSLRAVPPCQAAFAMLHRINDTCDSEAIARQLQSRLAVSITRAGGSTVLDDVADTDDKGSSTQGELSTKVIDFDYATVIAGEPGDEVRGIERTAPGRDFTETIETFLRLLGLPLGLPLEIILLNWTRSNYSQSRAVLEQAFTGFMGWQTLLKRGFHSPVYEWFIQNAIDAGDLEDREDKFSHDWIAPTFPWIDQMAEAQAYGAKLDRTLCTHAEALKSQNKDREEVLSARRREIVDAIIMAKEIEKETGEAVDWRPFAGLAFSVNGPAGKPDADPNGEEVDDDEDEGGEEPKEQVLRIKNDTPLFVINNQIEPTPIMNEIHSPAVSVTNEVNPTPITNQVNPTPVINQVEPAPVNITNEVKTPDVHVSPTPVEIRNDIQLPPPKPKKGLWFIKDESGDIIGAEPKD